MRIESPEISVAEGVVFDDGWAGRTVVFAVAAIPEGGVLTLEAWNPDLSITLFDNRIRLASGPEADERRVRLGESVTLRIRLAPGQAARVTLSVARALAPDLMDARERALVLTRVRLEAT